MSGKAGLIAAGFSAHLGIPIKTEEEAKTIETTRTQRRPICGKIGCGYIVAASVSTTNLFDYSSNRLQDSNGGYSVRVFGQESGTESNVDPNSTVGDIKQEIAYQNNIPTDQRQSIVLQYGGKKLDDKKTPREQNVPLGSTLISSRTYWYGDGPHPVYYIKDSDLEPEKDYDFTREERKTCERGGYVYERPVGWDRCALKVKGKYENDIWLGEDGWRDKSTPGEWAVSYHGTKMTNTRSISATGYKTSKSEREEYGKGIYSTPSIEVAAGYATEFSHEGRKYKMVLQNRLNLEESTQVPACRTGDDAAYFVTPNEYNIRPYGVCLKGEAIAATETGWSYCLLM